MEYMKTSTVTLLLAFATFATATPVLAIEPSTPSAVVTPAEVAAIKTYSIRELNAKAASIAGEIVKVKFSYLIGSYPVKESTDSFAILGDKDAVRIMSRVPKEGANWLAKLPLREGNRSFTAFARVERIEAPGISNNASQLTILGKEVKVDLKAASFTW